MRLVALLSLLSAGACCGQSTPTVLAENYTVEKKVSYSSYPETVLDVYIPNGGSNERRPGVLVIHGGGWSGGSKDAVVDWLVLPWVRRGFVAVNIEYRLTKSAPAPAAVSDVLAAAAWFERNAKKYNVDAKRIVVTGDSAGGHLSLMTGMASKDSKLGPGNSVAAVVDFYGITDVADQMQGANMQEYAVKWVPEQAGRFELANRVSPVSYVRKDLPPILAIHGDADKVVPYEHSVQLVRALRRVGADAELIPVRDGGHGFDPATLEGIFNQIWAFLRRRGILK